MDPPPALVQRDRPPAVGTLRTGFPLFHDGLVIETPPLEPDAAAAMVEHLGRS